MSSPVQKKRALVEAAARRFHQQGLNGTSLVEVASDAAVAPGNVFYHFRSKEALALAVSDEWCDRLRSALAQIEGLYPSPLDRLQALIDRAAGNAADYTEHGCPLAAIVRDFHWSAVEAPETAPFPLLLNWIALQFAAAGEPSADRNARFLLSALQGSFILAQAQHRAETIAEVTDMLRDWLSSLKKTH